MRASTHLSIDHEHGAPVRRLQRQVTAAVKDDGATGLLGALQRNAGNQAVSHLLRQYAGQRAAGAPAAGLTVQRQAEQEEEVQAKFATPIQRQEDKEEEAQAKLVDAAPIQRESEDEEAQAKFADAAAIQRQEDKEEEAQAKLVDATPIRRQEEKEEEQAQAKAEVGLQGGLLSRTLVARIQARRGGGAPLEAHTRTMMEGAFNTSFATVYIHTDGEAHALNRSISAIAFTVGSDIFFREGAYNPGTWNGRALLAHELTHVVQQRAMSARGPMRVGPAGDSYEREADTKGATVARMLDASYGAGPSRPRVRSGIKAEGLIRRASAWGRRTVATRGRYRRRRVAYLALGSVTVYGGPFVQRQDDTEADVTDADSMQVDPVADVSGDGAEHEEVAFGQALKVHGQTRARFSSSFKTSNLTTTVGSGCMTCKPPVCVHATGTLESAFTVNVKVILPKASDFPGLTPCQKQKVQEFIDTTLTAHEQQHVDAFTMYNGDTQQQFDLTLCRGKLASKMQAMHSAEERSRHKAAQDASDALDQGGANQFKVDIDCDDSTASETPDTGTPDGASAQSSDAVMV